MKTTVALRLGVVLAGLALAAPARAALGEPAASIPADQAALRARRATTARGAYVIERLVSTANTVREYVAPSGVVFAVSWEGVSRPDLSVLLGAHAAEYRRALSQLGPAPGHRRRRVETGGAVVETWGHMRALRGRAYVPALVPAGVSLDEIR